MRHETRRTISDYTTDSGRRPLLGRSPTLKTPTALCRPNRWLLGTGPKFPDFGLNSYKH